MSYDVVIVGAGPAGGMAARILATGGAKVALLDKRKEVGIPVQCGEGVSHLALEENGLLPQNAWIKHRVKGGLFICPNGNNFKVRIPGYSVEREKFDPWITYDAVDMGAELHMETRASGVKREDGLWKVATTKGDFEGKILIAADGPHGIVASNLGILKSRIFFNGFDWKFKSEDYTGIDTDWLEFYMGARFQRGYGWAFPRGDEWNIGVGGFGNNAKIIKDFLNSLGIDAGKCVSKTAGIIPYNYELEYLARDGVIIAGDAAGLTNPTFGGGIHAALTSGRMAGEAAAHALAEEDPAQVAVYEKKLRKEPYLDPVVLKSADIVHRWPDEDWNFLGFLFEGLNDTTELSTFATFKKILKNPQYIKRIGELKTVKKGMHINQRYGW